MKTIAVFLDIENIDILCDALRARQNEMLDNMEYDNVKHEKIDNLKTLLLKAREKIS